MTGPHSLQQSARVMAAVEREIADSLRQSAAIFRERGQHFSADFTASMIEPARRDPELYREWARAQQERAGL